jgi:serine/threonine protein kinase
VSRRWKIADFGTASEATSKKFNTTQFSRGSSSYRAPEILKENAKYNNKVDVWAFGCILYELSTGQKLFPNDWAVMEYVTKGALKFPLAWPENSLVGVEDCAPKLSLDAYTDFSKNLLSTLDLVSSSRPKALDLANTYYRALSILENNSLGAKLDLLDRKIEIVTISMLPGGRFGGK